MSHVRNLFRKPLGERHDLAAHSNDSVAENDAQANDFQEVPVVDADIVLANRVIVYREPHSLGADRFRILRLRLRERWNVGPLKSLLITSPLAHDGKSTITLNLATALSERGKYSVLVIEADLHHSSLVQQLGLKPWAGLAECIERGLSPAAAVRRVEPFGWYMVPAGEASSNPTDLLHSSALANTMQQLVPSFDWVLIDSPPLIPLPDTLSLRQQVDTSLLVVRAGRTPHEAVEESIALLGRQHIFGIILNGVEDAHRRYARYGYGQTQSDTGFQG